MRRSICIPVPTANPTAMLDTPIVGANVAAVVVDMTIVIILIVTGITVLCRA